MARAAFSITVVGRVQGVGFRAFVRRRATELGLDGWVRNRRNGSVEIVAIGASDLVDRLVELCARGPALAHVQAVTRHPAFDDGTTGFHERPTE